MKAAIRWEKQSATADSAPAKFVPGDFCDTIQIFVGQASVGVHRSPRLFAARINFSLLDLSSKPDQLAKTCRAQGAVITELHCKELSRITDEDNFVGWLEAHSDVAERVCCTEILAIKQTGDPTDSPVSGGGMLDADSLRQLTMTIEQPYLPLQMLQDSLFTSRNNNTESVAHKALVGHLKMLPLNRLEITSFRLDASIGVEDLVIVQTITQVLGRDGDVCMEDSFGKPDVPGHGNVETCECMPIDVVEYDVHLRTAQVQENGQYYATKEWGGRVPIRIRLHAGDPAQPMLEFNMATSLSTCRKAFGHERMRGTVELSASYNNINKAHWEPLVESWNMSFHTCATDFRARTHNTSDGAHHAALLLKPQNRKC